MCVSKSGMIKLITSDNHTKWFYVIKQSTVHISSLTILVI